MNKKQIYKKTFIRDFSLVNIEIWYRAESKNFKQWTNTNQPYQPYIVFERKNNLVNVYYGSQGLAWTEKELIKKISEKGFLKKIEETVKEKILPIKKIYENIQTLNHRDLVDFLDRFEDLYPWMEALWFLCTITKKKIDINPLKKIRDETDKLAPNTELVIRKSVSNCFPKYKKYADVISGNEVKTQQLPSKAELEKRKNGYWFTDNKLFIGTTKKLIEKLFGVEIETIDSKNITQLKGQIAYKGIVQGRVKLLMSFKEVDKVKKGDIIVSSMTMLDVLPAMERAAAIVTDEGGVLCHAAIISRELKKPCIVGTKIATQVFKDGDLVEVDANKGVVRIIEQEKTDWTILRSRYIPALFPFMIYWVWDIEKEIGIEEVKEVHAWKEGLVWAIWSEKSLRDLGVKVLEKLKTWNLKKLRLKGYRAGENCLKYVKQFSKKNHTPKEYLTFFKKFTELYVDLMRYNMIYWLFAGKTLEKKLSAKIKDDSVIRVMSMPKEESYSAKEEQDFQTLINLAENNFGKKTIREIKKFVKKYYWFPYEYVGPDIWTEESVTQRIKNSLHKKEFFEKENVAKQQIALIKKFKFSKETINDFELLQFCTLLQDDRKMYHSHICYYVNELIMRKMAKTLQISFEKARLVEETILKKYVETKDFKLFNKELDERLKFFVVGRKKSGENYFFSGKNGEKFLEEQKVELPIPIEHVSQVKGQIAFKGKVQGKARVLRTSQINDFKEGEIIFTGMSTPDFVPLIKKAAAIVTDEGGVLCHAAIISRELKKPCIVGTKIATQVFKDGDLVEVDANKGVVKKLK